MPRPEPDHRWRAVRIATSRPDHPAEGQLWDRLRDGGPDCAASRAMEIRDSEARDAMCAWLLACKSNAEVSRRTGVPEDEVAAFRHLFFDTTVFRHHMDLICWVRGYSSEQGSPEGSRLLRWAVMYGPEAVAHLTGLPCSMDPSEVMRQSMVDSHFRALEGRDSTIDGKAAREALRHRQVAIVLAENLSRAAPPTARDFAVKLRHRELTATKIEVIDATAGDNDEVEILH